MPRIARTALILVALPLAANAAPSYTAVDIEQLDSAYAYTTAINDQGQILGAGFDQNFNYYNFLYSNGTITKLDPVPSSTTVDLTGLNNQGQVAGWYINGVFGHASAMLYSPAEAFDQVATVNSPNYIQTTATAVNDNGTLVGQAVTADGQGHAFSSWDGFVNDLGTLPGDQGSAATAINTQGDIVGSSYNYAAGTHHAFEYANGAMIDLGTLTPGGNSDATAINDVGMVAGTATAANGTQRAYVYSNGVMTDLGYLDNPDIDAEYGIDPNNYGFSSQATGINNAGTVVGTSTLYGAFVYTGGTMYNLSDLVQNPIDTSFSSVAINNLGQIVADGYDGHVYLLTDTTGTTGGTAQSGATGTGSSGGTDSSNDTASDVPEPEGFLPTMVAFGLLGLAALTARRRRMEAQATSANPAPSASLAA